MADINANKVDDMLDALNKAIEIHTTKAVQGLSYNKSELAEVVDITERNLGKYIVWNGSTRYYAFSENTTYPIGTKVYVNIPNNDFSAQKQIVGQYVADGEPGIFYKNPLEAYEPLTPNLIEDIVLGEKSDIYKDDNIADLLANWDLTKELEEEDPPLEQMVEIFRAENLDKIEDSEERKKHDYQGFKYMGISADFKTMLNTFTPIAGDYGIAVILWGADRLDVTEDVELKKRTYTLSVRDMIGNVYNYSSYFKQASLYDVSDFKRILKVIVGFYQRGNFKDNTNHFIPVSYTMPKKIVNSETGEIEEIQEKHLLQPNLFVRNVSVQFGNDLINKNDGLRIYTINGETYDPVQKDALNSKTIESQWTHLNSSTNQYEVLKSVADAQKNGINEFTIHWYRDAIHSPLDYNANANDAEIAGEKKKLTAYDEWLAIEQDENATLDQKQEARLILVGSYGLKAPDDYNERDGFALTPNGRAKVENARTNIERSISTSQSIASDILAGAGWKPIEMAGHNFTQTNFLPDYSRAYSKVLCIIEYGPKVNGQFDTTSPDYFMVKSNEIQFNNLRMTSNSLSDDKANALKITCNDGTDGNYPIYNGTDGSLLNRADVSKIRELEANCFSLATGEDYFNGNEILIWKIPRSASMIKINEEAIKSNLLDAAGLAAITLKIEFDNKFYYIKRESTNGSSPTKIQEYTIAANYKRENVNNTVFCYLIKNNEVFEASKSMTFGQHGSSGTDYTFTLGFIQKVDSEWNVVGQADTALTIGDENYLEIGFDLYNAKDEKIDLTQSQKNDIITAWTDFELDGYYSGLSNPEDENDTSSNNAENLDFLIDLESSRVAVRVKPTITNINNLRYIVLKAAVKQSNVEGLGGVKFEQLLPIHIRAAETDWILEGSDYIVYDDKGANPTCYNDYYKLVGTRNGVQTEFKSGFTIESTDFDNSLRKKSYYPRLISFNEENNIKIDYKLQTTPLYIEDISRDLAICCGTLYTCPLVILKNKYQIPAINSWNGELTVDQAGNKILASMIGAGHKNENNTFSGVLMGDVIQKNHHTAENETMTGLFGYDDGEQTFGFNTNGTAFIGKSDIGRIYVDGNTGRITSSQREQYEINADLYAKTDDIMYLDTDPRGTDINLKDNYIDIQGIGNNTRVHLDTSLGPSLNETLELGENEAQSRHTGAYLSVDSDNGNRLLHVGNNNYYLQTDNYSEINKEGLKLDLKNGILNSYDKITINGATGSSINFGNNDNYLRLGNSDGGAYFNMYKAAGNPDNAFKTLRQAFNDLQQESNIAVNLLTNNVPVINNNELPANGHNKDYYKLIVDGNELNPIDNKLSSLSNDLTTYSSNLETKGQELAQAENALKDATSTYNDKNEAYLTQRQKYEEDEALFRGGLSNEIDATIAQLELELGNYVDETHDEASGLRGNRAAAWENYEEEERLYQQKLSEYEAKIGDGKDFETRISQCQAILDQLARDKVNLQNERIRLESELAQAQQEDNQALIDDLTAQIGRIDDQISEIDRQLSEQGTVKSGIENDYNAWLEANNLIDLKNALDAQEHKRDVALAAVNSIDITIAGKERELADAEYLKENLDSELERLANNLMTLGPNVLSVNDTDRLLISYDANPSKPLNERSVWGTVSENGYLLTEKNTAENALSTAQGNFNTAETAFNEAQDQFNATEKAYNDLNSKYVFYKNAYQDYIDNIDNNGDGTIAITNQGASSDKRITVGKNFYVTGEGKIFSSGGTVGGWEIGDKYLKSINNTTWLLSKDQDVARSVSGLSSSKKDWRILAGTENSYNFGVDKAGNLYSKSGNIAGWQIKNGYLTTGTAGKNNIVAVSTSDGDGSKTWAFVAGSNSHDVWGEAPFRVSHDGHLYAKNADISGKISASSISGGSITGASISGSSISGGTVTAESLTLGGVKVGWYTLKVMTDITSIKAATVSRAIVVQSVGNGWDQRISIPLGTQITVNYSTASFNILGSAGTGNDSATSSGHDVGLAYAYDSQSWQAASGNSGYSPGSGGNGHIVP